MFYMNTYEKWIADSINQIANKEVYFNTDMIMKDSEEISTNIVAELIGWACKPQNAHYPYTG